MVVVLDPGDFDGVRAVGTGKVPLYWRRVTLRVALRPEAVTAELRRRLNVAAIHLPMSQGLADRWPRRTEPQSGTYWQGCDPSESAVAYIGEGRAPKTAGFISKRIHRSMEISGVTVRLQLLRLPQIAGRAGAL